MGVLSRLLGRRVDRRRGVLAEDPIDPGEHPRPPVAPPLTRAQPRLERPEPTPSMRRVPNLGRTAGTPDYRAPAGTPSTQRLHNPRHPGRPRAPAPPPPAPPGPLARSRPPPRPAREPLPPRVQQHGLRDRRDAAA